MHALIFMKGYSERVASKNVRVVGGKPLCHHILQTCEEVPQISSVVVNTDSDIIAKECESFPKVVVQHRSDFLRTITNNEANLIIKEMLDEFIDTTYINLHSTSPLLQSRTISDAIDSFDSSDCDSIFSVTQHQSRFYDHAWNPINHDPDQLIRTQDLKLIYEENSGFYIFTREFFYRNSSRKGGESGCYPTERLESIDIDTEEDLLMADLLLQSRVS